MVDSNYNVNVNPVAIVKFAGHVEFLARVSESAALSLYDSYDESLDFLKSTPEICPQYYPSIPIGADLRYKLFGKWYRIVFEIIAKDVFVYDIQDCRQDADKSLI